MEGLSRKMDELGDRIAEEEEMDRNMNGILRVTRREFERYCNVRDGNGEI